MATSEHSAILFWAEHGERSSSVAAERRNGGERKRVDEKRGERRKVRRQEGRRKRDGGE